MFGQLSSPQEVFLARHHLQAAGLLERKQSYMNTRLQQDTLVAVQSHPGAVQEEDQTAYIVQERRRINATLRSETLDTLQRIWPLQGCNRKEPKSPSPCCRQHRTKDTTDLHPARLLRRAAMGTNATISSQSNMTDGDPCSRVATATSPSTQAPTQALTQAPTQAPT